MRTKQEILEELKEARDLLYNCFYTVSAFETGPLGTPGMLMYDHQDIKELKEAQHKLILWGYITKDQCEV